MRGRNDDKRALIHEQARNTNEPDADSSPIDDTRNRDVVDYRVFCSLFNDGTLDINTFLFCFFFKIVSTENIRRFRYRICVETS